MLSVSTNHALSCPGVGQLTRRIASHGNHKPRGARDDVFAATTPSVDVRRPGAGGGATYFAMTPPPSNTFMGLVYPKFGLFGNPVKPDGTL